MGRARRISCTQNRQGYVIGGGCEWSRCVMACGIGWMAMACRRVSSVGNQGLALARASLQLPGLARGLAFCEELVHDLGAGGDDGA